MARMIPLHLPPKNPSSAERILFDELENACPADWVVLHSLDLARRGSGPFGEADFVVIAPGFGILCVEAKTYLARTEDGLWRTDPTAPPHGHSPFRQANDAMYRIREWLSDHNLPDVLAAAVVIVPDMEITNRDQIEWAPWQLIDRPRYHSRSVEQLVCEAFDAQRHTLAQPPAPLTTDAASRIVRTLRGEVESYISPRARIEQQLDEVRRYTDEQFQVIDQLAGNPRLLVDGLAGTGKTLLAIESARRSVEDGRRVLLLCFNRLLSERLRSETGPLGDACTTLTIHEFMQHLVGEKWRPGLSAEYWDQKLPELAYNWIESEASSGFERFDELIVDEAQDIVCKEDFVMVLDAVLAQGLQNGRWRFFGDFEQQDIFGRLDGSPRLALEQTLGYQPPLVRLRVNCRNLPRVAHLADVLATGGDGYRAVRRDDDGLDPRVVYYDGAKTAKKALVDALETLHAEGFDPGRIVVLSRRSASHCLATRIDSAPWGDRLKPYSEADGGYTGYDSIFRFKGLEAPAVVVTDIDPLDGSARWSDEGDVRSLLYVAATRALSRVVLLVHDSWRGVLELEPMDELGLDAKEAIGLRSGLEGGPYDQVAEDPEVFGIVLPTIPREWFVRPNGRDAYETIHGGGHTLRVWVHAMELAETLGFADDEQEALHHAALWHDIGRTHDGVDYYHGAKSAGRVHGLGLHQGVDPVVLEMALFAVTHHSGSEEHAEQGVSWTASPESTLRVFRALKDADGLDRVRLGDLDPSYLRFDESRDRVDRAWGLLARYP